MSIRIGHASIDEHGKASGGASGDQTGKEVCIRAWYSKPWSLLLRYPDSAVAARAAAACEAACANPNIGYDQYQRNTAHTLARANGYDLAALAKCETDCSAFVTLCFLAAGVTALEYPANGNAPTTSTMRAAFMKAGFTALTGANYLTGTDCLKRGDVLVSPGHHTVMVLDDGAKSTGSDTKVTAKSGTSVEAASGKNASLAGVYTAKTHLNLRAGAGTDKAVITIIAAGDKVQCYGYYSTDKNGTVWPYVAYNGKTGYCSRGYLLRK